MKNLRKNLQVWNTNTYGNISSKIAAALESIQKVDLRAEIDELSEDEIRLRKEEFVILWDLLKHKERLDCQKSRSKHVRFGDCNSKYFQVMMKSRSRRNQIMGLHHSDSWVEEPEAVKAIIHDHFFERFQEQRHCRPRLSYMNFKKLSLVEKANLEIEFSIEEIRCAVSECGAEKAPGPDGFSFAIIKHIWDIIEEDVFDFIKEFHQNGKLVSGLNSTFIVLIPKVNNPTSLDEYRPISLIGYLYKILAKTLSIRLRKVLNSVIGNSQTAFLAGRQILDGVLILNEVIHDLKSKKKSGFILKADFSKAFDCLSWSFLDNTLAAMGFGSKWRNWISSCLSSSSISILVNGSPTQAFKPSRGLKQGDPLSPFLFIIAAEAFNVLMQSAMNAGLFKGIQIGCGNLTLSHLQYADDTIIMGAPTIQNINAAKFILRWYEFLSGLSINFKKSKLYTINCSSSWSNTAALSLNCRLDKFPSTYLGLPIGGSPTKYNFWKPVIEKFEKKLCAWKCRLLSAGARVTLVNSILSSLPLYFCSLFKLPVCVAKKLNSLMRSFFWGQSSNSRKTYWTSWDKICSDKDVGGLGIPNIKNKNIALLLKWWSRFSSENDSLWKKVLVAKYYNGFPCLSPLCTESNSMSRVWSDILSVGSIATNSNRLLSSCFNWSIGSGLNTRFWLDEWLTSPSLKYTFPRLFCIAANQNALV